MKVQGCPICKYLCLYEGTARSHLGSVVLNTKGRTGCLLTSASALQLSTDICEWVLLVAAIRSAIYYLCVIHTTLRREATAESLKSCIVTSVVPRECMYEAGACPCRST